MPVETSQEFVPIHTIEARHVLAAIPGDTLRRKLLWVELARMNLTRELGDTDKAAQAMYNAISKIDTALDVFFKTEDNGTSSFETARRAIADIYTAVDNLT